MAILLKKNQKKNLTDKKYLKKVYKLQHNLNLSNLVTGKKISNSIFNNSKNYKFKIKKYKLIRKNLRKIKNYLKINKKSTTFCFYIEPIKITNISSYERPHSHKIWENFFIQIYGFDFKLCNYIIKFIGYHKNILYTNLDECFFLYFKSFFKKYEEHLSVKLYMASLQIRTKLRFLYKGIRFFQNYPSRGQRTRSNFNTSANRRAPMKYWVFKKFITESYLSKVFPNWNNMKSFYFHR